MLIGQDVCHLKTAKLLAFLIGVVIPCSTEVFSAEEWISFKDFTVGKSLVFEGNEN